MTFEYHNVDAYIRSQIDGIFKSLEQESDKTKVVEGLSRCSELLNKLKPHSHDPLEVFIDVLKYKNDIRGKIASRAITFVGGAEIEKLKEEYKSVIQDVGEVTKKLEELDFKVPEEYDESVFGKLTGKLDHIRFDGDYDSNIGQIIEKYNNIISDLVAYIKDQHDSQEVETEEAVEGAVEESQEQLRLKLFDI